MSITMQSAVSVSAAALVAAVLLGCEAPVSAPSASPTVGAVDCARVLEMTPAEAAEYLAGQGWTVSWRLETTTDAGPFAEVVSEAPDGVVTDVVVEGDEVIVFVTPADDPLLEQIPAGQRCPDR